MESSKKLRWLKLKVFLTSLLMEPVLNNLKSSNKQTVKMDNERG